MSDKNIVEGGEGGGSEASASYYGRCPPASEVDADET